MNKEYSLVYNEEDKRFYLYDNEDYVFDTPHWGQAIYKFEQLIGMD